MTPGWPSVSQPPTSPPRPHPVLPSQVKMSIQPATPASQKKKWAIGHKVSASLNPLLISLRGLRQDSGCNAKLKLAADGSMAAVTGRRALQAWGSLLGSKYRENNNSTHCHHCLHYTWAGLRQKHVCAQVATHTFSHHATRLDSGHMHAFFLPEMANTPTAVY